VSHHELRTRCMIMVGVRKQAWTWAMPVECLEGWATLDLDHRRMVQSSEAVRNRSGSKGDSCTRYTAPRCPGKVAAYCSPREVRHACTCSKVGFCPAARGSPEDSWWGLKGLYLRGLGCGDMLQSLLHAEPHAVAFATLGFSA